MIEDKTGAKRHGVTYPLSPMQRGMWFNTQRDGQGSEILQIAGRFDEALDVSAFKAAWHECVASHPILRTHFEVKGHEAPIQRVRPDVTIPFETRHDLMDRPSSEQNDALERFRESDRKRGIDLSAAPLMRLTLFKLSAEHFYLVWTFSHAILDGRSFVRVLREVLTRYDALTTEREASTASEGPSSKSLDSKTLSYETYVQWLETQDWAESASYWTNQLNGLTAPPALAPAMEQGTGAPSDRPRARFERQCSPAVTEAITQAADKMGVSFSTMVYAAWSLLLRRYTGSDDTIFGAVRAGRHIPLEDAQEAVGVYINTVPLRLNVQPDRTVRGWLNGVRDVWRSLRDHEHVPLAQIQRWSSVPANRQLFDSLVVFDRATIDAQVHAGRDGWEGRHFRLFQHTSYPLNLYAYGGETLTLQLEVDPGRFAHLPVDRFLPQLETILRELAADTERPVGSVPVLSPEEREELLVGWNDTDRGYSAKGVHEFFEQQVARTPTATALVYQDKTLTYDALDRRANQLAHHLRELGVTPGTLVGVCAERSLEMMVALLGILKAGGAYVPLDPSYPADRLAFMVRDAGLSTIITVGNEPQFINGAEVQVVDLRRDASALDKEPTRPLAERIDPGQLAYVIYTSGSTGRPKGVQVTHRNVANFFAGMDDRIGTRPEAQDVWLAVTSISFDISVLELFWTLGNGFKVVLQPDQNQQVAAAPSSASNGTTSLSASNGHEREREEANSSIDFSLFYFSSDEKLDAVNGAASDKYRLLLEGARFGDQNGFEAVWTPERHFHDFGGLYPNPSVISAAIAASTTRIGIRAGSCVAPLHHPVRIAEDWAVVDNLSGGRVGISFASGWQPDDFVIDPSAYDSRKTVMFERIEQVRALWRGDALSFDDAKGGQTAVRTLPRPVQSDLPIWVTAAGNPETFRMAGERGYNVLTHLLGQSAEELTEKIEVYRAARAKHGHDPSTGKVTIMLHAFVGDDDEDVRSIVREPMKAYLRSSIGLIKKAAWSFPTFKQKTTGQDGQFAPERLSEDDMEHVLDFSFERYYETSGLFGTPDRCLELVSDLRERGVDEIACLLDFGLDAQLVLDHLPNLADVRRRAQQTGESTPSGRPARFSDAPSTESAPSTAQPVRGDAAERRAPSRLAERDAVNYSIASQIRRHSVTHLQCTPSQARILAADDDTRPALSSLDHMLVGGEAFPPALARDLSNLVSGRVTNMYGPTETTIWSSTWDVAPFDGQVPIGRPIANTQVYVLDPQMRPVPVGVPGTLWIGGDGVTEGYLGREPLTAERFVANPFGNGRIYDTGDVARYDDDGTLQFLGRNDFQVKIRGHRIELGEIEAALEARPTVHSAVVVVRAGDDQAGSNEAVHNEAVRNGAGSADAQRDQRLVAYLQAVDGVSIDTGEMRKALKSQLPDVMVPSVYAVLETFPLTPNGKVDRNALPDPEPVKRPTAAYEAPAGNVEQTISNVWRSVLNMDQISASDNFFDLGGHSLLAAQVVRQLSERLGQDVPVVSLFQYPTIRALAEHLGGAVEEADSGASRGQSRAEMRRQRMMRR